MEFNLRYILLFIITVLVVIGSLDVNVQKITPWLLGINFTLAIFSINFTFFGHQLSKYKAIYSKVSNRQWFNIITLMVLPFVPLVAFLIVPDYFGKIAFWILPLIMFSAIDNARLTTRYLSPRYFIENSFTPRKIDKYLSSLSMEVKKEVDEHQDYLDNRDKFQIPTHAYDFEPTILGLEPDDIWDSISVITRSEESRVGKECRL